MAAVMKPPVIFHPEYDNALFQSWSNCPRAITPSKWYHQPCRNQFAAKKSGWSETNGKIVTASPCTNGNSKNTVPIPAIPCTKWICMMSFLSMMEDRELLGKSKISMGKKWYSKHPSKFSMACHSFIWCYSFPYLICFLYFC